LNYFLKEALRIDAPSSFGLFYSAKEDTEICGVPFSKGARLVINCVYPHFNPTEWHAPTEFIPERFDPESEYFLKPGSSKKEARHPKAYIPFTFGSRNCPGQALGKLEARVIFSRLLAVIDYEIDEELLKKDFALFNLLANITMKGKIIPKMFKE